MKLYVIRDKRDGTYLRKSRGFSDDRHVNDITKAQIFKGIGGIKASLYGWKRAYPETGMPPWVEIVEITTSIG